MPRQRTLAMSWVQYGAAMRKLKDWWRSRAGPRFEPDEADWRRARESLHLLTGLNPAEAARLEALAQRFLRSKALEPVQGLELTEPMRESIALQACLPVLELGLEWYRGWYAVIIYPDVFVPAHEVEDEDGVVWTDHEVKSGESWERGPVILSWSDVRSGNRLDGYNVIIHELAHKLDACSGSTNGCPPLHPRMSAAAWERVFSTAFDDLGRRVEGGEDSRIDPYAAESPAEFFAVVSEAFFEVPAVLRDDYPDVYAQLCAFYRQDPIARLKRR